MSVSLLEIVECAEGEFVLKRAENAAEPLVTIRFSPEARSYMSDNGLGVATAMFQAAFQAASVSSEYVETEIAPVVPPVLH